MAVLERKTNNPQAAAEAEQRHQVANNLLSLDASQLKIESSSRLVACENPISLLPGVLFWKQWIRRTQEGAS